MYVKSEPDCDFDMTMEMMTDVETTLLREELFGNYIPSDVSESSSDDDLLHKLSHELEMPVMDEFEQVPSWPPDSKDIIDTFTNNHLSNIYKQEEDLTADELKESLYPNFDCSTEMISSKVKCQVIKQEPNTVQNFMQLPPSPHESHDIWELLCDSDVKPTLTSLITPPVTPPQSDGSPPHSPQPLLSPPAATVVLSPATSQQNQAINRASASTNTTSQPIKVLTITTRNGTTTQGQTKTGRVTKTMKIQPKAATNSTTQPQVISIVNSSNGQKITIPKSVVTTRSLTSTGARVVQLMKPSPTPTRVTTTTSSMTNSLPTMLTTQIGGTSTVLTPTVTTPLTPLAPALTPGMKQGNIPDLKALKRQQRMIKNRESASLSRKKKKEYVTALETNVNELKVENQKLKEENSRLHQRVASLESECSSLRQALGRNPSRKTTTALFALIFLLSINLGPLTGVLFSSESRLSSLKTMLQGDEPSSITSGFKQRSLLWSADYDTATDERVPSLYGMNASYMCPMYINATESQRIETELRGLFENKLGSSKMYKKDRVGSVHPKTTQGRSRASLYDNTFDSPDVKPGAAEKDWYALAAPSTTMKPPMKLYQYIHPDVLHVDSSSRSEENTSVMTTLPRISSFLEAIQRRDDTYYVVSFSPDHLLVPATARNDSARPKMSLLMPTPRPMNDSLAPPAAHIAMMQIDCEVIHTRLIHVSEEVVPAHLRAAGSSNTSHPAPDATTTSHPHERRHSRANKARPFFSKSSQPAK
ncbi:hypothetical protein SK128_010985 [Halocaridina rubra]|uniref:BZIP domain-containing protein n=1 Tax=Halocaridina rubra TaxID=373956 RepID=A0AAN8XKY8_HALRR